MGMSMGSSSGRKRGYRRYVPMSDINVTPMVDVMLVLLVIFMIAAPLLTVGVPVDLPRTEARPLQGDEEPLTISINREGQIFFQDTRVEPEQIVPRLTAISGTGYDQRIFVRGDASVNYGIVMDVMGRINKAGFRRVGLVTQTEEKR